MASQKQRRMRITGEVLTIEAGKKIASYRLSEFPADFGRGFLLGKLDANNDTVEHYWIYLDDAQSSCTCLGHTRHGHCKHVDAVKKLVELGRI